MEDSIEGQNQRTHGNHLKYEMELSKSMYKLCKRSKQKQCNAQKLGDNNAATRIYKVWDDLAESSPKHKTEQY